MNITLFLIIYFFIISIITIFLYKTDKEKARLGRKRISEQALHLAAMLGGTPAAFYAQKKFRHKTKKLSFQITFWMIALAQIALFYFFNNLISKAL